VWSPVEKFLAGLTGVALATTLVLPGRQTPVIADKVFSGLSKLFGSVIASNR
jgi:hypothetical protein